MLTLTMSPPKPEGGAHKLMGAPHRESLRPKFHRPTIPNLLPLRPAMFRRPSGIVRRVMSHVSSRPAKATHELIPPAFDEAVHTLRTLAQLRAKDKDIEKNIFLSQLKGNDENMFYKLAVEHMSEVTPLIYTPTVGDACIQFSKNYRRPEGIVSSCSDVPQSNAATNTNGRSSSPSKTRATLAKFLRAGHVCRRLELQ